MTTINFLKNDKLYKYMYIVNIKRIFNFNQFFQKLTFCTKIPNYWLLIYY